MRYNDGVVVPAELHGISDARVGWAPPIKVDLAAN